MSNKKIWFITGAGRGMGADFAKAALAAGHWVVATGRDTDRVSKALGQSNDLLPVKLDVTSRADAEAAVRAVGTLITAIRTPPATKNHRSTCGSVHEAPNLRRRVQPHPERLAPLPVPDLAIQAKTRALVARLRGPDRDADLETQMHRLPTPTLVLFGTLDHVIPPEMGRFYRELLPNCHLVFVYDAGHAISTERPEAFAEVTVDFLERREAFVVSRTETVIHP